MRHYARAYAAGVAASGVKLDAPSIAVNVLPWPEVLRAGAASDDEHVIKLVYACRKEWEREWEWQVTGNGNGNGR